jgi:hypothetical protein
LVLSHMASGGVKLNLFQDNILFQWRFCGLGFKSHG